MFIGAATVRERYVAALRGLTESQSAAVARRWRRTPNGARQYSK